MPILLYCYVSLKCHCLDTTQRQMMERVRCRLHYNLFSLPMWKLIATDIVHISAVCSAVQTSRSSFSSSTARCTMGPLTAYSTIFTVGFMVSMVSTLGRDNPFSDIFSLGSPRRDVVRLDKALDTVEDIEADVSEEQGPPGWQPPLAPKMSCGPRRKKHMFLGKSNRILVAEMS